MNLADMRAMIADETALEPRVEPWRKDMNRLLNRSFRKLCELAEWPWLVERQPFWQLPDAQFTAVFLGSHPNTAISVLLSELTTWLKHTTDSDSYFELGDMLMDAEVEPIDRLSNTAAGFEPWWKAPFKVEKITVSGAPPTAWIVSLDPRFNPDVSAAAPDNGARFVWRRRALPPNAMRALRVIDESGHPVPILDAAEAARMVRGTGTMSSTLTDVLEQTGANVRAYVVDQGFEPRFAPRDLDRVQGTDEQGYTQLRSRNLIARANTPPHQGITLAQQAGGSLALNSSWRLFGSWMYGGRFSPPTPVQHITIDTLNNQIDVTVPAYDAATHANGRRFTIWMAPGNTETGEGEGAFYLAGIAAAHDTTVIDIPYWPGNTNVVGASSGARISPNALVRWDEVYSERYLYLRPWPRPTAMQRHTLEYLRKPNELVEDNDVPEGMPESFHVAIVHHALVDLYGRFNAENQVAVQAALLKEQVDLMRRRYLPRSPRQKSMITQPNLGLTIDGVDWQG